MNKKGFLSVDCDEGDQSSYRSFNLQVGKKTIKFDTGDPVVDWIDYRRYIDKHRLFIVRSSTIYNWYMDDNNYYELYHDPVQGCTVSNETLLRRGMGYFEQILGFVAKKEMNSLKEILEYYKKVKGG